MADVVYSGDKGRETHYPVDPSTDARVRLCPLVECFLSDGSGDESLGALICADSARQVSFISVVLIGLGGSVEAGVVDEGHLCSQGVQSVFILSDLADK